MTWALRTTILMALLLGLAVSGTQGGELEHERVFGPETPTGIYKHPACLTELDNGDLYLVYYGGSGEYAKGTAVFGSRRKQGEESWLEPSVVARDPFRSVGNAVVWQAPDGLVWLFYVVRYGETWSTSRIQVKISDDEARSWSDASMLATEEGLMVRNRPIVLADGDYLLPVYKEVGDDPERVGSESASLFLRFDPKAKTWTESGRIRSPNGNIQPAVIQLSDKDLIAYCRRGGGYGPGEVGHIVVSESQDGGQTWSKGRDSEFPNPNAAIDLLKLDSGSLLLVYNDSMTKRTPLTLALSEDQGQTWPIRRNLDDRDVDLAYPIALQASDGKIHVVYTSDRRTVVNHAVFDEDWVRQSSE